MLAPVYGFYTETDIIHGTRQQFKIIQQKGCYKTHPDTHRSAFKSIYRTCRQYIDICLDSRIVEYDSPLPGVKRIFRLILRGTAEHGVRHLHFIAQQTISHIIHAYCGKKRLLASAPMAGHVGVRRIGETPDREVRIHRHQRIHRSTEVVVVSSGRSTD